MRCGAPSARGAHQPGKKTGYVCPYSFHIMDPAWGTS